MVAFNVCGMTKISSLLIIDDELDVRKTLINIFQQEGVSRISDVPSAEEALKILNEEPFSLIICDYRLPGITGVGFMGSCDLREIKRPFF